MGYFIMVIIITVLVLNYLSKKIALSKICYNREISKKAVEPKEDFDIEITVENKKLFPVGFFQIMETIPKDLKYRMPGNIFKTDNFIYHTSTMSLQPNETIIRKFKANLEKRGRYRLSEVELISGDLFALNLVQKFIECSREIIVMPEVLYPEDKLVPYGSYYGDISVRRWIIEDPVLTLGIREYTGYEPQKNIHWPSSLKANKLMVKNYDYTTDSSALCLLNVECSKPCWNDVKPALIEECISLTRGVLEEFEEQNTPYGFLTNGQNDEKDLISKNIGEVHFFGIMQSLGKIGYAARCDFENMLKEALDMVGTYTNFVIITPKILDSYVDYINLLGKVSSKVMVIGMSCENMDKLDRNIVTFVEGSDMIEA